MPKNAQNCLIADGVFSTGEISHNSTWQQALTLRPHTVKAHLMPHKMASATSAVSHYSHPLFIYDEKKFRRHTLLIGTLQRTVYGLPNNNLQYLMDTGLSWFCVCCAFKEGGSPAGSSGGGAPAEIKFGATDMS